MTSTATRSLWRKGRDPSSSFGIAMALAAGKPPCGLGGPVLPAGFLSSRTSRLLPPSQRHIPALKASLHSDRPAGDKGRFPCPKGRDSLNSLALPGVTRGQRNGGVTEPPLTKASHQLCVIVSEQTGAERCFSFTVALDQGGWKDGF